MTEVSEHMMFFVFTGLLALWFAHERALSLMMFFQQEEYDGKRFLTWLGEKKAYDKLASLLLLISFAVGFAAQQTPAFNEPINISLMVAILIAASLISGILRSRNTRQNSKKPLVKTTRVKRILTVFWGLSASMYVLFSFVALMAPAGDQYSLEVASNAENLLDTVSLSEQSYNWPSLIMALLLVAFCQFQPLILVLSNKVLEPMEERVKARFRNEAVEKFSKLKPKVIAITGSFGKTSTKHILSHILGAAAPSLATPGSVNTDMGITRVIREQLKPEHQFFIVEMGAYGPGSIARLCKLTPPDVGLITAVGAAHYERFKSLDTVAKAKFELAEAVFKNSGNAVVSTDGIDSKLLSERMHAVPGNYIKAGKSGDIQLTDLQQTADGLILTVQDGGESHLLKTPLYGRHQCDNILLAAASARAVGLPWSAIKGALATIPQIKHRLEVGKNSSGPTIVNDAYNSNPIGFASALESLDVLVGKNGRRILVTPGMVELGDKHAEEHERLGKLAAKHCDIVLIVTPERIPTFVSGLNAANDGAVTVMTFAKQEEAEAWAKANWRQNDVVLFENNLPDLYEATVRF